jgi:hypothetical protein
MNKHEKEQQYQKAQRRVRRLERYKLDNLKSLFKPRDKLSETPLRTGIVGQFGGLAWYEPKPKWGTTIFVEGKS